MERYFQAPWSGREVLGVVFVTIILMLAAMAGVTFVDNQYLIEMFGGQTVYISIIFLIQTGILLGPLLIYSATRKSFKSSTFFLRPIGFFRTLFAALSGYLKYLLITALISILILYTGIKIPGYQIQQEIVSLFGNSTFAIGVAALVIVVLAPIAEEIFFRGFLLPSTVDRIGKFWGNILTALIFASFHLQWQSIVPIFILGLIINSIAIKYRSIFPTIAFHIFNNAIAFTLQILLITKVISLEDLI